MKYFLFGTFIILFSCKQRKVEPYEINPQNFSENKFILSNIADNIKYIPLDNTFPIGLIYAIEANDDVFYLNTKDEGIIQFDLNGKYIKTIAKKGRGPSEYRYGMVFAVDEKTEKVYISDSKRIKVYSKNGIFIRNISTEKYLSNTAGDIKFLGNNIVITDYGTYGEFKFNWIVLDSLGNLISAKKSFVQPVDWVIRGGTYKFDNKLFYYNMLNDTIFSISPDLKYNAKYLFYKGEYRWPKTGVKLNSLSKLATYFKPFSIIETMHFILIYYGYQKRTSFVLFDKKTNKTYQAYKEEKMEKVNSTACISNDLDGGIPITAEPIYPYYLIKNNSEYIVSIINPLELKTHIASNAFKNSNPKYPEKKKALKKLANRLNENDNPVLMLIKLKD